MTTEPVTIRPMLEEDLDRVIDLDSDAGGMRRGDFFRKRWRAMQVAPEAYLGLVAIQADSVSGFVLAHLLSGEFGAEERFAILDGLGVESSRQGAGIGPNLMDALKQEARVRGCIEVHTQIAWDQQKLLCFFAGAGFLPAAVNVLERRLDEH